MTCSNSAITTALLVQQFGSSKMLAYCDRIASIIKDALNTPDPTGLIKGAGKINMDLHPTKGYFISTKKTIWVTDLNGKAYMVTIEEV